MLFEGTGTGAGASCAACCAGRAGAGGAPWGGGGGGGGGTGGGGGAGWADVDGIGWACEHAARAAAKNVSFRIFISFSSALLSWDHPRFFWRSASDCAPAIP